MKTLTFLIIMGLGLTGCMGSVPQLVESYQYGDDTKSCNSLEKEIGTIEAEIQELYIHHSEKIGGNIMVGAAAILFFPPALLIMDASSDEMAEITALLNRRDTLRSICISNDCWVPGTEVLTNDEYLASIGKKAPGTKEDPAEMSPPTINGKPQLSEGS